jgi:type I restriction enzyme, S subunit
MFGDPKGNSKGWEVKKLGEIFKVGSSKRIYQSEQPPSGVPFLRISNLVQRIETGSNSSELYIYQKNSIIRLKKSH